MNPEKKIEALTHQFESLKCRNCGKYPRVKISIKKDLPQFDYMEVCCESFRLLLVGYMQKLNNEIMNDANKNLKKDKTTISD